MSIRLITFDLDDTFWETTPAIQSAETALRDWLAAHALRLGDFPIEALGAIRRMLVEQEPALRHRISELRRRILQHALQDAGYPADEANGLAEQAFQVFLDARHEVQIFPDATHPGVPGQSLHPRRDHQRQCGCAPPGPGGLLPVHPVR